MTHHASPAFWVCYNDLPIPVKEVADRAFSLLKRDPHHPSLHFKKVGSFWSARVGLRHRAVGIEISDGVLWFWIGTHSQYDNLVTR